MGIVFVFIGLIMITQLYFRFAIQKGIIDYPNSRSSHIRPTIRGAGIVIPISALCFLLPERTDLLYFIFGLFIIAIISFIDDVYPLSSKTRVVVQFASVLLMFYQLSLFSMPWWIVVVALILVLGIINAVNFMDGINGMTVAYSIVFVASISYLSFFYFHIIQQKMLIYLLLGLLIVGWYNFRPFARCFAGDVGSVSVAFIFCFLLIILISNTQNVSFILFLLLYGIDTVLTIIQRIYHGDNIFKAHRKHLFQYLVNERGYGHLAVSAGYAFVQLGVNILVIANYIHQWVDPWNTLISCILVTSVIYIIYKYFIYRNYVKILAD